MKWYIASRTRHKEKVKEWVNLLRSKGDDVVFDWTKADLLIPYDQNPKESSQIAKELSITIPNADIFVLISDAAGTDMFVELGIAIVNAQQMGKPKIYIVGEYNKRSLMHFHPAIIHTDTIEEVFSIECPEIINKKTDFLDSDCR